MDERNNDKEKEEIALQSHLNDKHKRSKGKWTMKSKWNFQNFGGRKSQNTKNSTCQRYESTCNKNGGQGNFRGEKKRINKSNEQCFKCQKFSHFSRECNANNKEPKGD